MVWNMLPKRVARYLRRGRNYAEPFSQASAAAAPRGEYLERAGLDRRLPAAGGWAWESQARNRAGAGWNPGTVTHRYLGRQVSPCPDGGLKLKLMASLQPRARLRRLLEVTG